nr:NADH dehydrogenase subunit 2 [Amblyseius swirskii]
MSNFMKINYSFIKILLMTMFANSLIFSMSSNSLLFTWLMMEVNLMMFIPIMKKMDFMSSNSMMTYFIIQSVSSMMFLFSYLMSKTMNSISMLQISLYLALMMKMGLFPFNSWFMQISKNMEWKQWFLLNTFQKLIPLWILSKNLMTYLTMMLIFLNSFYSMIEMLNQTSLRWAMSASSINHTIWMIYSMMAQMHQWEIYFITYMMISYFLMKFLYKNSWNSMNNMINNENSNKNNYFFLIMMNFIGIPPFIMFIPKILVLMNTYSLFIMFIMIFNNILISMMYLTYCFPMIKKNTKNKLKNMKSKYLWSFMILNSGYILIMF